MTKERYDQINSEIQCIDEGHSIDELLGGYFDLPRPKLDAYLAGLTDAERREYNIMWAAETSAEYERELRSQQVGQRGE